MFLRRRCSNGVVVSVLFRGEVLWLLLLSMVVGTKSSSSSSETRSTTNNNKSQTIELLNVTELECRMRYLTLSYAIQIQPWLLVKDDDDDEKEENDDDTQQYYHRHHYASSRSSTRSSRRTRTDSIILRYMEDALQIQDVACPLYKDDDDDASATTTPPLFTTTTTTASTFQQQRRRVEATAVDVQHQQQNKKAKRSFTTKQQRGKEVGGGKDNSMSSSSSPSVPISSSSASSFEDRCHTRYCIYIEPTTNTHKNSNTTTTTTITTVVPTLHDALDISRSHPYNDPYNTTIVFRSGIHFVGRGGCAISIKQQQHPKMMTAPIILTAVDSGLTIVGEPNAWISGGIAIPNDIEWGYDVINSKIRVTNLTLLLQDYLVDGVIPTELPSLFGSGSTSSLPNNPTQRFIRARYPNSHPETDQWGYNSPNRLVYSIPAEQVLEWHKPPPNGVTPSFDYVDLRQTDNDKNDPHYHRPIKNDSTMELYNVYAAGYGGVCSDLWDANIDEPSYWCSNASDGGWAEVDRECATTGRLNLPVGMTYNSTNALGQHMVQYWNTNSSAIGAIIHAWHSQSWAMHMFRIANVSSDSSSLYFERGGGKQGGRNWCRCDQCSYAAPWCGQRQHPTPNNSDTRLISGTWYIENIRTELDQPGEYYFDKHTNLLYFYPNSTSTKQNEAPVNDRRSNDNDDDHDNPNKAGLHDLRLAIYEGLIRIEDNATDIRIHNLGFRDTASTYMSEWSVPSGGDWSIHRGGAILVENVNNIAIVNCTFSRLDGNGIFVSRRTRNVTIAQNLFEWLGESAIALWGDTQGFNATGRNFPLYTVITGNVMRELGIYEKQSSAVFMSKAARTVITHNIMFNLPRAAINFNDMMGGGDVVHRNVIFNTCRESGDHGPINSWDRQPFLSDIRTPGEPSFVPIRRILSYNLIFANYGASQGLDNDDGSSWYHVHHNVFHNANGFKMDYGGHDSIFEDNIVIGYPNKGMCIGFGSFFDGHGHIVRRNTCYVTNTRQGMVQLESGCTPNYAQLYDNRYFVPTNMTPTVQCGWDSDPMPFDQFRQLYPTIEINSTIETTPNNAKTIVGSAVHLLYNDNDNVGIDIGDVSTNDMMYYSAKNKMHHTTDATLTNE